MRDFPSGHNKYSTYCIAFFINLTMYYESYQAAQNDEQNEEGVEEQYQSLIQAQEQDMVEQTSIQSQEHDLPGDEIEFPAKQVVNEVVL